MANTFSKDLLDRIVLIQKGISGIKQAYPRFWMPIGNNDFPVFYNGIASVQSDLTKGRPIRPRVLLVNMRLIVGGLASGYQGEREDDANNLMMEVIDTFDRHQRLGYQALQPLQYVESAFLLDNQTGIQPFDYSDAQSGPPLFYLGIQYTLKVTANFNVGRID